MPPLSSPTLSSSLTIALAFGAPAAAQQLEPCPTAQLSPAPPAEYIDFGAPLVYSQGLLAAAALAPWYGAPGDPPDSSSVHTWRRLPDGAWEPLPELGPLSPEKSFGYSLGLSDARLVVGHPHLSAASREAGRAEVYALVGEAWVHEATLALPSGHDDDDFGYAVAVDGDTAVVGAPGLFLPGLAVAGAFVYRRTGAGEWVQTTALLSVDDPFFGRAVAIDGETLAVGAPTAGAGQAKVHVYERAHGGWTLAATVADPLQPGDDDFGRALDLDGDLLAVGNSSFVERVVLFRRGLEGEWALEQVLESPLDDSSAWFGDAVAVDGERLVVGAWLAQGWPASSAFSGAAVVYERGPGGWVVLTEVVPQSFHPVLPPSPGIGFELGRAVALDGDLVIAGASQGFSSTGDYDGAVYLIELVPPAPLVGCPGELSLAVGGVQFLEVDAGPAHAGELHLLLGSSTGTTPATPLDGVLVPLVPDAYSLFTIASANQAPLIGTLGVLDSAGAATPKFRLTPGTEPALAGALLHHASVVFDSGSGQAVFATNAVPLQLVP
ncbi:MAG TPA: hypothetical protein VJP77_04050 [Planctomycetota bacterium]|nr:hypothetical protein [Planctomycetota bacterium]